MKSMCTKAVATAMACALLSGPGLADAEQSSRPVTGNDSSLSGSLVNPDQRLKLEVHKQAANPFDERTSDQLPLGGVETITFVLHLAPGFDVTTEEGRKEASRARTQEEWDEIERHEVARATTNSKGIATFTDLTPGLYLLEELTPDVEHDYRTSSPKWLVLPLAEAQGRAFAHGNTVVVKPAPCPTCKPPVPLPVPVPSTGPPTTATTTAPPPGPPETPDPSTSPTSSNQPPSDGNGPTQGGISRSPLAESGADVLGLIALGLTLIGLGMFLARRKAS